MKKIIFLLPLFLLLFSACKSDDNATTKGTSVVKATINGVEKTFNTVTVVRSNIHSSETYLVTASINNDPNETFKFNIYTEYPTDSHDFLSSIDYFKNNITYYIINSGKDGNLVVTYFGDRTYKGNFSANLFGDDNKSVKITNGSFEIYY